MRNIYSRIFDMIGEILKYNKDPSEYRLKIDEIIK